MEEEKQKKVKGIQIEIVKLGSSHTTINVTLIDHFFCFTNIIIEQMPQE